ncbi:hypothetical protein HRR81_000923 [Exophiala dermatitidis]|nr:hypothetical protein HRR81_000923 [Exophiala dermatitidis]KAJ4696283.1 hypothetical protein HRR87_002883 [Exophiala dermatitidis]
MLPAWPRLVCGPLPLSLSAATHYHCPSHFSILNANLTCIIATTRSQFRRTGRCQMTGTGPTGRLTSRKLGPPPHQTTTGSIHLPRPSKTPQASKRSSKKRPPNLDGVGGFILSSRNNLANPPKHFLCYTHKSLLLRPRKERLLQKDGTYMNEQIP